MPRNLVKEERIKILALHGRGLNISQISQELNIARQTVRRWVKRHAGEKSIEDRPRVMPKRVLTEDRMAHILQVYSEQPLTATKTLANLYDCSMRTIRNGLHAAGVNLSANKIALDDEQKHARVRFARDYRDFDFSNAIFSDGRTFRSSSQCGKNLWCMDNTRYQLRNVPKLSGGNFVNMWGWMSAAGPGELVATKGRSSGQSYAHLLQDTMLPTVRTVYPREEMPYFFFFHQINPVHRAQVVQNWFQQHPEIKAVELPSASPDLNPVEYLWATMVQRWDGKSKKGKPVFINHCDEVWDWFRGGTLCEVVVRSMRRRLDSVIDAGGAMT